jgi:hypothetical protein
MRDESTRQAAQEFLAAKLTEEAQKEEHRLNQETAVARSLQVWKSFREAIFSQCEEWNAVTQERTLTCKETPLGDLRIWCADTSKYMTAHYDSRKLLVTIRNAGRSENEKDLQLQIEGYSTGSERSAHLVRNNEPANIPVLILGELRLLSGIGRQRSA